LNDWQRSKLEVGNENQNELVIEAVKENNFEALEFLAKNIELSWNQSYAETAWKLKRFSCLSLLLSHDSPFPDSFNLNQIDHHNAKAISKILNERLFFIDAIQKGSIEDIEDFLDRNRNMKVGYDLNNKAALTVAVEAGKIEIYEMLKVRGFRSGL
jgi:hypothetical protein